MAWTPGWEADLLSCRTPADFERLDLSPVEHLARRLRATRSDGTPRARYNYTPDAPQANRVYIVLQGAPDKPGGWTEDYLAYPILRLSRVLGVFALIPAPPQRVPCSSQKRSGIPGGCIASLANIHVHFRSQPQDVPLSVLG